MSLEPIGMVMIVLGLLTLRYGMGFGLGVFNSALIFGAAAAINLPALGGSSVQPSHFLLLFIALLAMAQPRYLQAAVACLRYPSPGFWFAGFVLYSVVTSFFLPRLFSGATLVYSSARSLNGPPAIIATPLGPTTGNITQTVYLLGSLFCFAIVAGFAYLGRTILIAKTLLTAAFACLLFAVADIVTSLTGQAYLLDFIRNANYATMTEGEISGFRRIVGSFPEASAYGAFALTLFAFSVVLLLERFRYKGIGLLTAAIGLTILLSTSTTAYVASVVPLFLVTMLCLAKMAKRTATFRHFAFLLIELLVVPIATMGLMLIPSVWNSISSLVEITLTNKLSSDSGVERMAWNKVALTTFFDTYGFGAGFGSVRGSSFLTTLLANVGIVGFLLFSLFGSSLILSVIKRQNLPPTEKTIALAALTASLTLMTGAVISGTSADLGLLFSVLAGLATGCALRPGGAVPQSAAVDARFTNTLPSTA